MKGLKYMIPIVLTATAAFGIIGPAQAAEPQITAIRSTGEGIVLTWDLSEDADLYGVFRKAKGEQWECIAEVPAKEETEVAASGIAAEAEAENAETEAATEEQTEVAEETALKAQPETAAEETTQEAPSETGEKTEAEDAMPETAPEEGTWTDSLILPGEEYLYCVRGYSKETDQWSQMADRGTLAVWEVTSAEITAGTVLTEEAVAALGEDSFFYTEEISDETFARMWKKSFKEYCTLDRADLRYIRCLHRDIDGNIKVGELVMNVLVADTVCGIFRQLYAAAYPIESMILVDEFDADDETSIMSNNTSAFNYRMVDNTDQISNHAFGLAIDINPYYNVYYIPSANYVFPPEGWKFLDREADFPYKLMPGDLCYNLFTEAGFNWGGWWTYNTDYQHFEYIP